MFIYSLNKLASCLSIVIFIIGPNLKLYILDKSKNGNISIFIIFIFAN